MANGVQKSSWGLVVFGVSTLILFFVPVLGLKYPYAGNAIYKTTLVYSGVVLSVLSFLIGHFSYPRVHNLKVYLLGYLNGVVGTAYFLPRLLHKSTSYSNIEMIFLMAFVNMIIVLAVPSFVKYRITKIITFSLVGFESVFMILLRFYPKLLVPAHHITRVDVLKEFSIVPFFVFIAVLLFTIWKMRDEFYLGGILSQTTLMYMLLWYVPMFFAPGYARGIDIISINFILLIFEINMVVHWLKRMEHRISYDPLLQIYNRNYCVKIIEEQSNVKTLPPFGVAMIDIDHFKNVNDTHGHQAGDKILYHVAQTIQNEVIPEGIACRYGGEEIIVFFPGAKMKDIKKRMEDVRVAIENMVVVFGRKKLSVTVSIGVSVREKYIQEISDVISSADKALYRAKKGGRNQIKTGKTPVPKK